MPVGKIIIIAIIILLLLGVTALTISLVVIFGDYYTPEPPKDDSVWGFMCEANTCVRFPRGGFPEFPEIPAFTNVTSLNVCQLTCGANIGNVWPMPRIDFENTQRSISWINPYAIGVRNMSFQGRANDYWSKAINRFYEMQSKKVPTHLRSYLNVNRRLDIELNIADTTTMTHNLRTPENYDLRIRRTPPWTDDILATITAPNFYGARHALETLSQIMTFDSFNNAFVMLDWIRFIDAPVFSHRGVSMDTSRNFYSVDDIKKTLDGMAMVKLNTFHWHITDSQSFPMHIEALPQFTRIGAYSPKEVYTREDMKEVTDYARSRGIRVIPEFDQPAHVGEGWQLFDMLTCFRAMPWHEFCYQAPCGQLDPSVPELFNVLEVIYKEMIENFEPVMFHMGGDEVTSSCWNSSERLQDYMIRNGLNPNEETSFMTLWGRFQEDVESSFIRAWNRTDNIDFILWSSTLTVQPYLTRYLDPNVHIIQWWGTRDDPVLQQLVQNNFRIIFSNHDRLYLDCGFSGWTSDGLNWCAPFKNWQGIYDNRLDTLVGTGNLNLALGAEVTIWSEQIDGNNLDTRLWPRAAALAERLWSNPPTTWAAAETRMVIQRHRMVESSNIKADRQYPEWCRQNQGLCPNRGL